MFYELRRGDRLSKGRTGPDRREKAVPHTNYPGQIRLNTSNVPYWLLIECSEHLKSELLRRLGIDPSQARAMTGESLANLFAYRLLAPTCWFAEDAKTFEYDLLALKQRYATSSHEVLAWRFLDLPEPCVV